MSIDDATVRLAAAGLALGLWFVTVLVAAGPAGWPAAVVGVLVTVAVARLEGDETIVRLRGAQP